MEMPVIIPLPIETKGKGFFQKIWAWITEVRSWKLAENWEYELKGTRIVIPKGFIFDGASIPRPLWGILSPTGLLLIPGLIHDFGYRFDYLWAVIPDTESGYIKIHEQAGQKYWDEVFYYLGMEINGIKTINFIAWLALSTMGFLAWNANRKRNYQDIDPSLICLTS